MLQIMKQQEEDSAGGDDHEDSPRDQLLYLSHNISSKLESSAAETERRELVAYLSQELESLRYQQASDSMFKAMAIKTKVYLEEKEEKFHNADFDEL